MTNISIELTSGQDTVLPTSEDATIVATSTTLNDADIISAGAGADLLVLNGPGTFRLDRIAEFTGVEDLQVINSTTSQSNVYLRDGVDLTVSGVGSGSVYYYLSTGSETIVAGSGNDVFSAERLGLLSATDSLDGGGGYDWLSYHVSSDAVIDLTGVRIQGVEYYSLGDSTFIVNSAALSSASYLYLFGSRLITSDATLDLRYKLAGDNSASPSSIASSNLSGTNFLVTNLQTANLIKGGTGYDVITATGFSFTQDQRTALFFNSSVEKIVDQTGTYFAPPKQISIELTSGQDTVLPTSEDATIVATSTTLNDADIISAGAGADLLVLNGPGTFRLDRIAEFTGVEDLQVINSTTSQSNVYLRDGVDLTVSGVGSGSVYYYLSTGSETIVAGSGNDVFSAERLGLLSATDSLDGGGGYDWLSYHVSSDAVIDLTGVRIQGVEYYSLGDSTFIVNSAALSSASYLYLFGSRLITSDATLDLRYKLAGDNSASPSSIASSNLSGTNFLVTNLQTANLIKGGTGYDVITATGFSFTQDQRTALFFNSSVEKIVDQTGTYFAINGSDGDDVIQGSLLGETINGRDGNDRIFGNGGNDVISGGSGDDFIETSFGAHAITGDEGNDFFQVTGISTGLPATAFDGGSGSDTFDMSRVFSGGNYMFFTDDGANPGAFFVADNHVTGVEVVNGSASGPNWFLLQGMSTPMTIRGGDQGDVFYTSFANADVMYGLGGDDFFSVRYNDTAYGGTGNDVFDLYSGGSGLADGGEGSDTLDLSFGWNVDLALGTAGGSGWGYTLTSVENVIVYAIAGYTSVVAGNDEANEFSVNANFNDGSIGVTFYGRGGDDQLRGSMGADYLSGGAGNDMLNGGAGADYMEGGAGDDRYYELEASDTIVEAADGGFDTVFTSASAFVLSSLTNVEALAYIGTGDFTGTGTTGNDMISGAAGNDRLSGGSGNDRLDGGEGNDVLIGGSGADLMIGGVGSDIYEVDDVNDVIVEHADQGTDDVYANVDFTLPDQVENLFMNYGLQTYGIGNASDNIIVGNSQANVIEGGAGNDVIDGGAGNDRLSGGSGNDRLDGGDGNDVLIGGLGADVLAGGDGSDVYEVDDTHDVIVEQAGHGTDTVYANADFTLPDQVENLFMNYGLQTYGIGNASDNIIVGNSQANVIEGGAGNDVIDGAAGNDRLSGGSGNDRLDGGEGNDVLIGGSGADLMIGGVGSDIYEVDDVNDVIVEQADQGTDDVYANVDFTLPDQVENLFMNYGLQTYGIGNASDNIIGGNSQANVIEGGAGNDVIDGGAGNDRLSGGSGNDRLDGGDGNDVLIGGLGADVMAGGDGSDVYEVDDAHDVIVEQAGHGTDTVYANADFTLPDKVENLFMNYGLQTYGIGNASDNIIVGNSQANVIEGGAGNDRLSGDAGDDRLDGGDGNDVLIGGLGADVMAGGDGSDVYEVDDTHDVIVEQAGHGTDTVYANADFTLPDQVENLFMNYGLQTYGIGNASDNIIIGNSQANVIEGGAGNDTITGGAGNDRFIVNPNFGVDVITDFVAGANTDDVVIFSQSLFTSFDQVMTNATQMGADTCINDGHGNTLLLIGVNMANLHADDFGFI